jgi:glutamate racemase
MIISQPFLTHFRVLERIFKKFEIESTCIERNKSKAHELSRLLKENAAKVVEQSKNLQVLKSKSEELRSSLSKWLVTAFNGKIFVTLA